MQSMWGELHEAAKIGDKAAIERLIEEGANPNARDEEQRTPLHAAAGHGQAAAMELLIKHNASLDARDEQQRTALHEAAFRSPAKAVIDFLVCHGVDPFSTDARGWIPLHEAVSEAVPDLVHHMCGQCDCHEQHPVDPSKVNAADPWGRTPLQVKRGTIESFLVLCADHAEVVPCVNVVDSEGSAAVTCTDGHLLQKVLQLHVDLGHLKVEENEDHHRLTRIQTHLLQQLLGKGDFIIPDHPLVNRWQDFVFGSMIPGGAVCSFPCNHHLDHSQEMEDILRFKGHPEELCRHLRDSFLGRCEEAWRMTYDVQQFLADLCSFFLEQCPLLQLDSRRVGSSAEGTKNGRPDEFDVLLHLAQLSECIKEVVDGRWIKWSELEVRAEAELAQCSPDKKNITRGVKVKLFRLITDFVTQKSSSWGPLSFRCLKQFKCGYSIILWHEEKKLCVKMDLVPLLSHLDKWYIFENVANYDSAVFESFALKELDHMRSLPPNARDGYALAKCLRNVHLLSHVIQKPLLSDLIDHFLPSHLLKHALFFAFEQEKHQSDPALIKPHEWARSIYHLLLTKRNLYNFFNHHYSLFHSDSRHYGRQYHLNRFLQRRNLPTFDLHATGLKKYREFFIDVILKILE